MIDLSQITFERSNTRTKKKFLNLVKIAISSRLYIPDLGGLRTYYFDALRNADILDREVICLAYFENVPIAVAYICDDRQLNVFVRRKYRRQGIGQAVAKRALGRNKSFNYGHSGTDTTNSYATDSFFSKIGKSTRY